jgi:hypothetical protein
MSNELLNMNPKEIRDFIGSKSFIEDQDTNRIIINLLLRLVDGKESHTKTVVKPTQKKTQSKSRAKK